MWCVKWTQARWSPGVFTFSVWQKWLWYWIWCASWTQAGYPGCIIIWCVYFECLTEVVMILDLVCQLDTGWIPRVHYHLVWLFQCLTEVVVILDLVCQLDTGQIPRVHQEIRRLYTRLSQDAAHSPTVLRILQFFLNHSEYFHEIIPTGKKSAILTQGTGKTYWRNWKLPWREILVLSVYVWGGMGGLSPAQRHSYWNCFKLLSRCYSSPWPSGRVQPFLWYRSHPAVPGPWAGIWHCRLHGQQPDYALLRHQHLLPLLPQHPQGVVVVQGSWLSKHSPQGQSGLEICLYAVD